MICLIAGFLLLLKPNANITYQSDKLQYDAGIPMESFAYSSYSGIYIDNSMKRSESQEHINATIPNVNLLPGSYQIIINYSSSDGDNSFTCSCYNNWTDFWKFENVVLPAGEDQSQIVKISSALPMKEVSVSVSYNGNGYLYLSSIQILGSKSLAIQIIYYCVLVILATVCFSSLWIKYGNEEKKLLFILTSAAFASSLPLFGILLGFGDDLEYHLLRIDALANGLKNGQLPVRISTYWNNGYGYAS